MVVRKHKLQKIEQDPQVDYDSSVLFDKPEVFEIVVDCDEYEQVDTDILDDEFELND